MPELEQALAAAQAQATTAAEEAAAARSQAASLHSQVAAGQARVVAERAQLAGERQALAAAWQPGDDEVAGLQAELMVLRSSLHARLPPTVATPGAAAGGAAEDTLHNSLQEHLYPTAAASPSSVGCAGECAAECAVEYSPGAADKQHGYTQCRTPGQLPQKPAGAGPLPGGCKAITPYSSSSA